MGRQRCATALVLAASLLCPIDASADQSCGQFYECGGRATGTASGNGFELGLFVPGSDGRAHDVSGGAYSCPDCRWEIVPACDANSPGTGDNDVNCARAVIACADTGGTLVDVYLKRPGQPWRVVNSFCSNPRQPVTTPAQIAELAAQRLEDLPLPPPGLQSQPPGGTAVNLPTVFWSDDTAPITISVTLRGFSASLTATPSSWRWDFGDGTSLTTAQPGAPYPNHSITHTYLGRGTVTATVTTTWVGTVEVPEMGELPITETVTRTSTRRIVVREARTELVTEER